MGEKPDGTAKPFSFFTCTLYSSSVPNGRKKILGSSSSFLEISEVMPVVDYKASVFLKVGSCTMKCSFSRV